MQDPFTEDFRQFRETVIHLPPLFREYSSNVERIKNALLLGNQIFYKYCDPNTGEMKLNVNSNSDFVNYLWAYESYLYQNSIMETYPPEQQKLFEASVRDRKITSIGSFTTSTKNIIVNSELVINMLRELENVPLTKDQRNFLDGFAMNIIEAFEPFVLEKELLTTQMNRILAYSRAVRRSDVSGQTKCSIMGVEAFAMDLERGCYHRPTGASRLVL